MSQLQYDVPLIGQSKAVPDWLITPDILPPTWEYMTNENRYAYGSSQRDSMFGQLLGAFVAEGKLDGIDDVPRMMELAWAIATKYGQKIGGQLAMRGL